MYKRLLAALLTIVLLVSYIPQGFVARAADPPPDISVVYLKTETDSEGNRVLKYEIHGLGFNNPKAYINGHEIIPTHYNTGLIIIERTPDINDAFEEGLKSIIVKNLDGQEDSTAFEVRTPPYIDYASKDKVYVGESLDIYGTGFADDLTRLYIAGTMYSIGPEGTPGVDAEIITDPEDPDVKWIRVAKVKAPVTSGLSDIKATRDAGAGTTTDPGDAIQGVLKSSITVVGKLTGVEVESLEPDAGSVNGGTIIRMMGAPGKCNFQSNMKVYIGGTDPENRATDVQVIKDSDGNVIGLQAKTPRGTPGPKEIIIRDVTEQNEYIVPFVFTYLQADNALLIQRVTPSYAKETEQKSIEIVGRNIGTINVEGVTVTNFVYGQYDSVNKEYVLQFEGTYNGEAVDIVRKIKLTVGGIAPINDVPMITIDEDRLEATTPIITLDPPEPKIVDVVVNTDTVIALTSEGSEQLHRVEEYILEDSFTYYPSKTIPTITGITPDRGPYNKDIYVTIEGSNFQVLADSSGGTEVIKYPVVKIGNKTIDPNPPRDPDDPMDPEPDPDYVLVYDDEGHLVDGKKYTLGTIIRTKISAYPDGDLGFVDVTVTNPDLGTWTEENIFEFKKPERLPGDMPRIDGIQPNKGTIDGGTAVTIYGKNFDYDLNEVRVIVTIDGARAEVVKVKNTGDQIDIITPPGTEGYKTVQVINEDGSMAELVDGYYYTRVNSAPVIDSIAPDYGGAGTEVIIRGADFRQPDPGSDLIDKKIGTRVLLNGEDVNSYLRDADGNILYDAISGEVLFEPDGKRVEVLDEYTIRVIIPPDLPIGPKDVTVLNPDTASYTVDDGFYYKSPASSPQIFDINGDSYAIVPEEGSVSGGTVVTIEGTDFREGVRVFFGGVEATSVSVNGDGNIIQATTPQYFITAPGADSEDVDVTVVNYDGGSCTERDGFTYRIPGSEPVITSLDPNEGSTAGEDTVIIWGQDFRREDSDGDGIYDRLPRVYFGGIEAVDVQWGNYNMLVVTTPAYPEEGRVDVILVNPDAGTYIAKNAFEYKRSSPKITSIIPDRGTKKGDEEITIKGSGFIKGDLSARYQGETVYKHVYAEEPAIDLLVVFGDETDSAPISGGRSEVAVGDIRVVYDSTDPMEDNTKVYLIPPAGADQFITGFNIVPGTYHLFIVNGPVDLGNDTIVDEGIKVEVSKNMLTVTRRVAPYVRWVDDGTLVVKTPPVAYIGERNVYVINKDGGTATGTFEYTNPDSDPVITDITPNREVYDTDGNLVEYLTEASVDGETFITIEGSDFRTGVRVFIGDREAEVVTKSNNDDMIIARVPAGDSTDVDKKLRVVVVNADGGTADSSLLPVPRWFVYRTPESNPIIDAVFPDKTSAAGGNTLRIVGFDFRPGARVIIGGREALNVNVISYKEITVETPAGLIAGTYDVQVINTDFGTDTLEDGITIVSNPDIEYITNENGSIITTVSFLGGDTVIIKGTAFQPGAKVVFGGEIKYQSEAPNEQGIEGINTRDEKVKVVGGKDASGIEVQDENTIKLTTPSGVEGDVTVIVINPDGGVSDAFDMEYTLPLPGRPDYLDVSLVYDRYVRLEWPKVDDALYYEIYASEEDRYDFKFLTSTTRNIYYVIDLEPDTRYYFKVKAINKFGSSEFTSYRWITTEDTGEPDVDGGINEAEKVLVSDDRVTVNIGEDSASEGAYYTYNIDLRDPNYRSPEKKYINIPLKVIREAHRTFTVDAGEIMLQFSPMALYVRALWGKTTSQEDNVYGRLIIDISPKSEGDRALKYLPPKHRPVSGLYCIGIAVQDGKKVQEYNEINGSMDIQIKYDYSRINGMDETKLAIYRFDQAELRWEPVEAAGVHTNVDLAYGRIRQPGIFAVLVKY